MKNFLKKIFKPVVDKVYNNTINTTTAEKIINKISVRSQISLIELAHKNMGIMKYQDMHVSGEDFFLKVLSNLFSYKDRLTVFDVGANIGSYTKALVAEFKNAEIYSFEPNPETYKMLVANTKTCNNVTRVCTAFGSIKEKAEIFTYTNDLVSGHASIMPEVITDLHKTDRIQNFLIDISTIDDYCKDNNISKIDFLKIDKEGYELEVLKGASAMLEKGSVDVVQFEFNEMNIIAHVFLKDFYEILNKYNFYRLDSTRLIPLHEYNPINEIFRFQNIIAIKNEIVNKLKT